MHTIANFAAMSLLMIALAAPSAIKAQVQTQPKAPPFDVVITNGHIIDGTGSPWYSGDIGIRAGRIAAIGNLGGASAKRTD